MEWNMGNIFNSTEEIAKVANYPNIRIYKINHQTSETPLDDLKVESGVGWSKTDNAGMVKAFSAVCLLTATYLADAMGKDKVIIKMI